MPDLLDAFFAANAERPWSWGDVDCAMVLADWAVSNGHPDPFKEYRRAYRSEEAWKAIVLPRGGMVSIVTGVLATSKIRPAAAVFRGAIGVIGSGSHPLRQWGAIHDGARWRVRHVDGFCFMTARALGVWRI